MHCEHCENSEVPCQTQYSVSGIAAKTANNPLEMGRYPGDMMAIEIRNWPEFNIKFVF
jgi:hypothetical protein